MPRQDGTGPNGQGPATGRGRGSCETEATRNDVSPHPRQSRLIGGGRGLGRGRCRYPQNQQQ